MPTFTALTTLTGRSPAEALGEALEALDPAPTGVGVFEVEDGSGLWEVGAYFTETPPGIELALLSTAFDARPFVVSELPETDWVAKVRRELAPVETERFVVYGSHDADNLPPGKIPLLIEAAMAFGTGHHGTTLGCLLAFEELLEAGLEPGKVADIGCGTAVLGMAAAKVWPGTIIASDIDQVAVEVAEANTKANNLEGRLHCIEAVGFDHPDIRDAAPFDLIFANILMGPLLGLAPDMARHSSPGTHMILSGILNDQADQVITVYAQNGINLVKKHQIGDWTTLILRHSPLID